MGCRVDIIAGATELERRIACQTHWRLAEAVLDGRQAPSDPDADRLVEMVDGVRLYQPQTIERMQSQGETIVTQQLQKHLVDGWWHATIVDIPD
jgi:hypothetical protein